MPVQTDETYFPSNETFQYVVRIRAEEIAHPNSPAVEKRGPLNVTTNYPQKQRTGQAAQSVIQPTRD
jgi:hypothetical protein